MRLHNTLTRRVETFSPISAKKAKLYTCGPTVYNYYHIGNLRNAVFNDTLRRTLEAAGYSVTHVMNITDVGHLVSDADEGEDKLEKGAKREGKSVWQVAEHYTDAFKHDMKALNVMPPNGYKSLKYRDTYARATEFIDAQVELVRILLDRGYAYQTEQAIYFDVSKFADYGALSGQTLADKEVGARSDVVTDDKKRHPADFALWFFTVGRYADHSMQWPSPWGNGFPGWHLECSAIIHATMGDPIDIHTGGVDHIGTHHPNEMAQTQAAYGHPLANYWVHNEFILVDGQKMAKSKGNAYTLSDITARGIHPLALRLLYLGAHYRTELNFSWAALEAAQTSLIGLYAWADRVHQNIGQPTHPMPSDWYEQIHRAMLDDLATPAALVLLYGWSNTAVPSKGDLAKLDTIFGLNFSGRKDITPAQKQLIDKREQARQHRQWAEADRLRNELAGQGLAIEDMADGPRWRRLIA